MAMMQLCAALFRIAEQVERRAPHEAEFAENFK
jgi:hypothetical protein